jgi:succinate-semialdehyde dehydrogenase/glutarate-semialdehyde dehydrogenase
MPIQTVNPATGELIKTYQEMSETEVTNIIDTTDKAYLFWREMDIAKRALPMRKLAEMLEDKKASLAAIITEEMGKPITYAIKEIEKCAWVCNFYALHAEEYLKPRIIETQMHKSYVTYLPLGIIFAIMPWNYPFWQVFRFAAPTIMAGNAALLKHAPICTGSGLAIEKLFIEAGFPENLFRTVILSNEGAEKVIAHRKIAGVTLTGSVLAGKTVGKEAATHLKKIVLELGGSDPYIILEDADLNAAAEAVVTSRLNNSGQVCIAAKRIIAVDKIREELISLVLEKTKQYTMGDPMDENTQLGPMARDDLRSEVNKQVKESIAQGAKLLLGGEIPSRKGFYYPPTVLTQIQKDMPAYREEIFGPVIAFIPAKDEKEAIHIANDTPFGLAAAIFTRDIQRGESIARDKIQAGSVAVNTYVSSDPRLPFGGIKSSGIGRELSVEGIRAFTNVKTISIK